MLLRLEAWIAAYAKFLGTLSAFLFLNLLFIVFYNVIMRYLFNDVSIAMQELEWHLYASIFLFGVSYGLASNSHVRVDLIYETRSVQQKAIIDLFGTLILLLPLCLLVFWYGIGFSFDAYSLGEGSGDPGGLPHRWIIKAMIPLAFISLAITGIGQILRAILILKGHQFKAYKAQLLD